MVLNIINNLNFRLFQAKLLESSHAWLGASTSSIAGEFEIQLTSKEAIHPVVQDALIKSSMITINDIDTVSCALNTALISGIIRDSLTNSAFIALRMLLTRK